MNFTANILRPILCTECSDMLDHSFRGEAGPDEGKLSAGATDSYNEGWGFQNLEH
jgi:hypothetical protein